MPPLEDLLAIGVVIAVAFLACALVSRSRLPSVVKLLLLAGVGLRFVGAYARQTMAADARIYFNWGHDFSQRFTQLDFSPLFDQSVWRHGEFLGTNFIGYPTALVISLLGPSWLGTFFAFGLLSFLGLVAYAVAYRRGFPGAPYAPYWAWVFLMPSLWFWPSSIGKESIMLVGMGIATLGFAGRGGRPQWLVMALGLVLVFCVRPQVVAVFMFAVMLSHWLHFGRWTVRRMAQGLAMLALGLTGLWFTMSATLGGDVSVEAITEYVDTNASRNDDGGSSIDGVGASPAAVPIAIMNVLFRPFLWEAHNATSAISALELALMWGLVLLRRRELAAALRHWREHRMLRFAIPFVMLYVIALGMNLSNLGLLARQRVLVFPLLFLIVEAGAYYRRAAAPEPAVALPRAPGRRLPVPSV